VPKPIPPSHIALAGLTAAALASCSDGGLTTPAPRPSTSAAGAPVTRSTVPVDPAVSRAETIALIEAPADDPNAAIDLTRHVPDHAIGYVEFASLEALEIATLRVKTLTGEAAADVQRTVALATSPLIEVGIDPTKLDRTKPIAVAFVPGSGLEGPRPVIIAPARSEGPIASSATALSARGMGARRVEDDYVVVEHAGAADSTGSSGNAAVTLDLPEGVVRGCFDTDVLAPMLAMPLYGAASDMNESYRLARPQRSAGDLYEFDADAALAWVRGTPRMAFAIQMQGDAATVVLRETERDGVARAGAPSNGAIMSSLAQHLSATDPISFVAAFDRNDVTERITRTLGEIWTVLDEFEVLGGEMSGRLELPNDEVAGEIERMLGSFHGAAAVSVDVEPGKALVAVYLLGTDIARTRQALSLLFSQCDVEEWGFELALPTRSVIAGTLVEDYTVRFDTSRLDFDQRAELREAFKTFLGDSTLHLKVATAGEHVMVLLGGDTAAVAGRIRAFSPGGACEPELRAAIEAASRGEDAIAGRVDTVALLGQLAGIRDVGRGHSVADTVRQIEREVGEGVAPFLFWSSFGGGARTMGAHFDFEAIPTAFDAFKGAGF